MDKLKIFSPVDGEINEISKIKDDMFSQKILGDGFFIKPNLDNEKIIINSFFEKSNLELVNDTKHALYLKNSLGPIGLIHIGLDSNKYDEKTFDLKVVKGDFLDLQTELIEYNSSFFKDNNLKSEIPVVFDPEESKNWEFKLIKTGKVKKGDLVGELSPKEKTETTTILKEISKDNSTSKYSLIAKQLIEIISKDNIERVANCMTRARFYVYDKTKIDMKKIQNVNSVKGAIWSGNELQIVFGGDAYKVKDSAEALLNMNGSNNLVKKNIIKQNIWQKFLGACNGIIVPLMPLLISTGLLSGLSALLVQLKLIDAGPPAGEFITSMDLWSGIVYILANTGLPLLSIFFCYSTVKYMKGDTTMGILIGLTIASRYFIAMSGGELGTGEWYLFNIGSFEVTIKGYLNNLLPAIAAGALYVYLDRFIKMWMPTQIDIVFRPILGYTITTLVFFFILGPILALVEKSLGIASAWFYDLPIGIGGFILGFIWQPIVFIGMGWPIWLSLDVAYFSGEGPLIGLPIMDAAAIGLIGVVIAMMIKSKNQKDRSSAGAVIAPLIFGITEPAMYGVTVPKVKPFWLGCIGASISGGLLAMFKVTRADIGGYGFLGVLGHSGDGSVRNLILYLSFSLIAVAINFLLVFFLWSEKKSEKNLYHKSMKKLFHYIKSRNKNEVNWKSFKEIFSEGSKAVLNNKSSYDNLYKNYINLLKYKDIEQNINANFEKTKASIFNKTEKYKLVNEVKYNAFLLKYNNFKMSYKQINKLNKLKEVEDLFNENIKAIKVVNNDIFKITSLHLEEVNKKFKIDNLNSFKDDFSNSINNLLISSNTEEELPVNLTKDIIYNTKNKSKLFFLR